MTSIKGLIKRSENKRDEYTQKLNVLMVNYYQGKIDALNEVLENELVMGVEKDSED